MTHDQQCRSFAYLWCVSQVSTDSPPWNVLPIEPAGAIIVIDTREESTQMIIESICEQHGDVLAVESINNPRTGRDVIGCLLRPHGDLIETADRLRACYHIGTEPDADDAEQGPF